jgi:hypothetical protein
MFETILMALGMVVALTSVVLACRKVPADPYAI